MNEVICYVPSHDRYVMRNNSSPEAVDEVFDSAKSRLKESCLKIIESLMPKNSQ